MAGRASSRHEPRGQRRGGSGRLPHPPMCLCGCSGPGRLCPPLWGSRGPLGRCPCVAHTTAASCTCAGASASQRPWRPKRLGDDGGSAASRVSPRATAGRRRCTCRRWSSARRPSGSAAAGSTRGRCRTWRSWLPRVGRRRAEGSRQEVVVAGSARTLGLVGVLPRVRPAEHVVDHLPLERRLRRHFALELEDVRARPAKEAHVLLILRQGGAASAWRAAGVRACRQVAAHLEEQEVAAGRAEVHGAARRRSASKRARCWRWVGGDNQ